MVSTRQRQKPTGQGEPAFCGGGSNNPARLSWTPEPVPPSGNWRPALPRVRCVRRACSASGQGDCLGTHITGLQVESAPTGGGLNVPKGVQMGRLDWSQQRPDHVTRHVFLHFSPFCSLRPPSTFPPPPLLYLPSHLSPRPSHHPLFCFSTLIGHQSNIYIFITRCAYSIDFCGHNS